MQRTELMRLTAGADYRMHQLRAVQRDGANVVEDCDFGLYRLVGFAWDLSTRRELVVCQGVAGQCHQRDEGQLFICSPQEFATRFRPVAEAEVAAEAASSPPLTAGAVTQGSGA